MPTFSEKLKEWTGFTQTSYTTYHAAWAAWAVSFIIDILKSGKPSIVGDMCLAESITSGTYFTVTGKDVMSVCRTSDGLPISLIDRENIIQMGNASSIFGATVNFPIAYFDEGATKLKVSPSVAFTVYYISASVNVTTGDITGMPTRFWELVYLACAIRCLDIVSAEAHVDLETYTDDEDSEFHNLSKSKLQTALTRKNELEKELAQRVKAMTGIVFNFKSRREYVRE